VPKLVARSGVRTIIFALMVVLVGGCDSWVDNGRYQLIHGSASGDWKEPGDIYIDRVYLLDTRTGKVWKGDHRSGSLSPMKREEALD
jgi:hypothetical protein